MSKRFFVTMDGELEPVEGGYFDDWDIVKAIDHDAEVDALVKALQRWMAVAEVSDLKVGDGADVFIRAVAATIELLAKYPQEGSDEL